MVEIAQLGIIGNCRSAALVGERGSIVFCCLPDFDSTSVFAKLLDENKGGEFAIIPEEGAVVSQAYLDRTNILCTEFNQQSGIFELLDFMPYYLNEDKSCTQPPEIYRLIRVKQGRPVVKIHYEPHLNYNQDPTASFLHEEFIKSNTVKGDYHSLYLYSNLALPALLEEQPITLFDGAFLLVSYHQKLIKVDRERVILEFERTKLYWMNWVERTRRFPLYQQEIIRSALTLKLLTYRRTGAVIAAVTTSLPENLHEARNWDYRFCWLRDASMIIRALREINHINSAHNFLSFLLDTMIDKADTLQVLYGIRGEKVLTEKKLTHLAGYKNCGPVVTGNAAYSQKQNDVYGILMDLIYASFLYFPGSLHAREELWTTVRFIVRTVEFNWDKPDKGIWEIRKEPRHFVFSKVLSWVAVDRGVAIAAMYGRTEFIDHWKALRDKIKTDIEAKGWNREKQAYTQFYGSQDLDASLLLLEKLGYCTKNDPRYISSVRAIYRELCRDGLMYRYRNKDDFGVPHSAFLICSFWMIDSLYQIGEKEKAVGMFASILASSNRLGLFSEDMDFDTRELLGNFPQGYSHLALINTAILLNGGNDVGTN